MKRSIQKQRFLLIAALATPLFDYANLSSAADDTSYHKHMAAKKTLCLANPYGFSAQQRQGPLQELVAMLQSLGLKCGNHLRAAVKLIRQARAERIASVRPIFAMCAKPAHCLQWSMVALRMRV